MRRSESVMPDPRAAAAGRLALLGGQIALDRLQEVRVRWKADGSMVTDVDLAIQERLCEEIRAAFPQDGILAEEGAIRPTWPPDPRYWWVLDPLDGTANYGQGIPGFGISVGVLRNGQPFAGAVYDPTADWLYLGCVGYGAWLNGRRLELQRQALSPRSFIAIRSPYEAGIPDFVLHWLGRYRVRRFGSTALQLCYVASGALALVHDQRAFLWDLAGAAPILLQAGGVLSRPDGTPLFPLHVEAYHGEPLAFLAGDPGGHAEGLQDILNQREPAGSRPGGQHGT